MEGLHLIIISIITSIFTMIGLYFLNHNKFAYKELKHKHEIELLQVKDKINSKRFKRKQSALNTQNSIETPGLLSNIGGLTKFLPLLRSLDSDQIGGLIDILRGEGVEADEESDIEGLLGGLPPGTLEKVIGGFMQGMNKNKNDQEGDQYGQV